MKIAITGATGFVGRELVKQCFPEHDLKLWYRPDSDRSSFAEFEEKIEWVEGELSDCDSIKALVKGCDAIVHSGLARSSRSFQAAETDNAAYVQTNVVGSIRLIEAAKSEKVNRFVFVSTCAVHDHILNDRPLDESHPLWANTHYGAHKAAIEKFVHSYGLGSGFPICAIRPTGIYGVQQPIQYSKWWDLVRDVVDGKSVEVSKGGKEVHVADVGKAIRLLLTAEGTIGQSYACYDQYISQYDVAHLAKELSGSKSQIIGEQRVPNNQIVTDKIEALGMEFGGDDLLRETIRELVEIAKQQSTGN